MAKTTIIILSMIGISGVAVAAAPRQAIIESYAANAGAVPSAERGKTLFLATHNGGKEATPTCTTCHGTDLSAPGRTRAGKQIDPLAPSASPERFTDPKFVEKWFTRNCRSVLGRECSALEKADVLTWLSGK